MKHYNIPFEMLTDIVLVGNPKNKRRNVWFSFNNEQKESCINSYSKVLEKAEEYCNVCRDFYDMLQESFDSFYYYNAENQFGIKSGKYYSQKEMISIIQYAIDAVKEELSAELEEIYYDALGGDWEG